MPSFLDTVQKKIIENYSPNFEHLVIVLPSQRAGLFLKKKLIESLGNATMILPEIISIETLISELSELENCDNETLLLIFYQAYITINPEKEKKDFENFLSWGQTLLQDFNEIDKYLIDHKQFFNYLYYIKDQRHWFLQEDKTTLIENYIQFWEQLEAYYNEFTTILSSKKIGYQGLQYRKAAENSVKISETSRKHYLFVGFNALNEAEQFIFKAFQKEKKASFIWDADHYFITDKIHDASYFLKKHQRLWKNPELYDTDIHYSFAKEKKINITGVPKNIGQVKYVGELLARLSPEMLTKTAIVLADENLLIPLLNSLPNNVKNVNITMGQPLSRTDISNFIAQLFNLKISQKEQGYYHKNILALLQHNAVKTLLDNQNCYALINYINTNNLVYIKSDLINHLLPNPKKPIINLLLTPWKNNTSFLNELKEILTLLISNYKSIEDLIQAYYCEKLVLIVQHLEELIHEHSHINTLKALIQFFNLKLQTETVDFRGEPFEGLQIMGILESRCLDFDHLIVTSINEGILPSGQKGNSFIPYDLKIEAKLPTYKEKDAIYAYHFYRLLQRCKTAHLLYNTQIDELNSGEKSRFLHQLELEPHPNHTVVSNIVTTGFENHFPPIQKITKNTEVIHKLQLLAKNGFSPSALTTYLRDPLLFYERYILGVKDSKVIEEEIAANTLGTIIHEVLCNFYTPLENKIVVAQDLQKMLLQIDQEVHKEFQKNYSEAQITHGVNLLNYEAAKAFIKKFLLSELDLINKGNELIIVSVEKKFKTEIPIPRLSFPVFIKGTVDRVDRLNGKLRIVDYKTGYVDPAKLKIKNWELLCSDEAYGKALQILMYAYMYCNEKKIKETVEGGIIAFKKLNQGFLPFAQTEGRKSNIAITPAVFELFLEQLEVLISEICDCNQPFISHELKNS